MNSPKIFAPTKEKFPHRFDMVKDPELRRALETFYSVYDGEKLIRWWASLYDPAEHGFYYSVSARDTEGFHPDMESTMQVCTKVLNFYADDMTAIVNGEMREGIIDFYRSRQDKETGYFFHPQFTREESTANVMRYTRDQDWSVNMLRYLHSSPLYPTALDRAKDKKEEKTDTRAWEPTEEGVRKYIAERFAEKNTEGWANALQTQCSAFEAAGMLGTVLDVLDETVNPEYGLWVSGYDETIDRYFDFRTPHQPETPYGVFTNAFKIVTMYSRGKRPVPYFENLVKNAIRTIESEAESARITYVFNPWAALGHLRMNLVNYGTPDMVVRYDAIIRENAVAMVKSSIHAMDPYRMEDGSFSFLPGRSAPVIYGTTVSLGVCEGDVNGNNLAVSFGAHICETMGYDTPIPIFTREDWQLFRRLIENAPPIVKKPAPKG